MFFGLLTVFGQQEKIDKKIEASEILIKKQIVCDDLERQVKDIQFAGVRVHTKYKIASWLWKDGKDDTNRAEYMAVSAIDDLYANKEEIPDPYLTILRSRLIALLEMHAKNSANKLREKYKIGSNGESGPLDSLLDQKGGEQLAVDAAIKSLAGDPQGNLEISVLAWRLQQRQSPQLLRLLTAILNSEETGQTKFNANTLISISGYFLESGIPVGLQKRFLKLVFDKSRNVAQTADSDTEGYFNLLSGRMLDISTKLPEVFAEASAVQIVLKTRISIALRESEEMYDRLGRSVDRVSALIAEAEQTDNKTLKYELYVNAATWALKEKKFIHSVDIAGKTVEIDLPNSSISEVFRKNWLDQFLRNVVDAALTSRDPDSANYATKKIVDSLSKVECLGKTANYYFDHSDSVSARYALDEAVKSIIKADGGDRKLLSLIALLPTVQKIDRDRISDISELTAKSINSIPSLDVEDKPQTEKYKKYVTSVMNINWNLLPALTKLLKENKSEAANLAGRINKKEIKIIADYVLLTDFDRAKPKSENSKK